MEEAIIGDWTWSNSIYTNTSSGDPFIINPDTLGYTIRYLYKDDGTFIVYKNDIEDGYGIYWFEEVEMVDDSLSILKLFIKREEFISSINVMLRGDTLVFDDNELNGITKVFLKE